MKPIAGFDSVIANDGGGEQLPAGAYVCVIHGAAEVQSKNGNQMLRIMFDIAEGPFTGFYKRKYDAQSGGPYSSNRQWRGVFNQLIYASGGGANAYFKGLTTAIEESNLGYTWDWNENALKGKKIGFVFRDEEYMSQNGQLRVVAKPVWPRAVAKVREGIEPPPIRRYEPQQTSYDGVGGYVPPPEYAPADEEPLPWEK